MVLIAASCGLLSGLGCSEEAPKEEAPGPKPPRQEALNEEVATDFETALRRTVHEIERFVEARSEASIQQFIDDFVAAEYRAAKSDEQLGELLGEIRRRFAGFGGVNVQSAGLASVVMRFTQSPGEDTALHVHVQTNPPYRITGLRLQKDAVAGSSGGQPPAPAPAGPSVPLTWETLEARLEAEVQAGFSGTVLVVRGGTPVLHRGFGLADRESGLANTTETIFAIGSVAMDFTKAAVLKLEDLGELQTADSIADYLPDVPEDKRAITLDHIFQGSSGLRNFHERPEDTDSVFTWVDRETALSRVLNEELLFPPGSQRNPSHSAYAVAAAIVEHVSGESLEHFFRRYFFDRAGMERTGFYGDWRFPADQVAVGYGDLTHGPVNSPSYWGKTSWLLMGSGGMVSNPSDLHKWVTALRTGEMLSAEALRKYLAPPGSVLAGGDSYGFIAAYTEGPGSMFFLCSNSSSKREATRQLIGDLARLMRMP
jgi:CubicO group peptidase (beta-lactamase class C family)